jgi:hypothetical protein
MKLDMSLARLVLLEVERLDHGKDDVLRVKIDGHSYWEVNYHVRSLSEAGLITAYPIPDTEPDEPDHWLPQHLLWEGHQYLEAVRDDEVWKQTIKKVAAVGGSATLEIVKATAVGVAKQLLGLPG